MFESDENPGAALEMVKPSENRTGSGCGVML